MGIAVESGFYKEPGSNKIFFVKSINGTSLYPVWVKSKPTDWIPLKINKKNNDNNNRK